MATDARCAAVENMDTDGAADDGAAAGAGGEVVLRQMDTAAVAWVKRVAATCGAASLVGLMLDERVGLRRVVRASDAAAVAAAAAAVSMSPAGAAAVSVELGEPLATAPLGADELPHMLFVPISASNARVQAELPLIFQVFEEARTRALDAAAAAEQPPPLYLIFAIGS